MNATLTIDDSLWPLVILRITGVLSSEQQEHFLLRSESFLAREEKYVSITDVRGAGTPPLAQCRQLAEWMRQHSAGLRKYLVSSALVATSAPLRLSMSIIFHLMPPPMPHLAVADMASAVEFALGKLEEAQQGPAAERIRRQLATADLSAL